MQSISTEFQIGLTPQEKRSEFVVKTQDRNSVRLEFSILNAIVDTVWVLITGRQLSIELPCTKENDIWIVNFDHTWITTPDELTAHLYGSIGTINTINYKRYDIGSVSFSVDISAIDSNLHETKIYYFEQVEDLINGLDARYIQSEQIRQNEFEEVEEARQAAEIIRHDYYENFKSRAESGEFNGLSAYEIALKYGFVGTEQAWNDAVNQNRILAQQAAGSSSDDLDQITLLKTAIDTIAQNVQGWANSTSINANNANQSAINAESSANTALQAAQNLNAAVTALAGTTTGLIAHTTTGNNYAPRTIVGTANQVLVAQGNGVSGNPTLSLPQDIHTGAIPTFAGEKLPVLTNLIVNGNFADLTGWSGGNAAVTASANTLTTTGDGTSANPFIITSASPPSLSLGDLIYQRAQVMVTNASCQGIRFFRGINTIEVIASPPQGAWLPVSAIASAQSTGIFQFRAYQYYADSATASGKVMQVRYVSLLNLTTIFGAGNEPTQSEMDRIMSYFGNSWFDGTADITPLLKALASRHEALTLRNPIINGAFAAGTSGFSGYGCTIAATSNTLTATGTGTSATIAASSTFGPTRPRAVGQVLYARCRMRATSAGAVSLSIQIGNGGNQVVSAPVNGQWYTISGVRSQTNSGDLLYVHPMAAYSDAAAATGATVEFQYFLCLDLTAIFGAGNEPSATEMDSLMAMFPNAWFDGYADPAIFQRWLVSRRVRFGTGSPEGAISAPVGTEYIDTAITNGAAKWIKNSGTGNTGWIVTVGDTGWRNVSSLLTNGWAGSLYIRRTAQAVEMLAEALSPTSATTTVAFTLPLGFRPAIDTRWAFSTTAVPPVFHRFLAAKSDGSLQYIGAIPQSIALYGSQMASAELSSWPTTLPGTSN